MLHKLCILKINRMTNEQDDSRKLNIIRTSFLGKTRVGIQKQEKSGKFKLDNIMFITVLHDALGCDCRENGKEGMMLGRR